jgi:hypothetical protein
MLTIFLTKQKLAWPWYVPLGTVVTVLTGLLLGTLAPRERTRS